MGSKLLFGAFMVVLVVAVLIARGFLKSAIRHGDLSIWWLVLGALAITVGVLLFAKPAGYFGARPSPPPIQRLAVWGRRSVDERGIDRLRDRLSRGRKCIDEKPTRQSERGPL
jgi:hypothetical protein